MEPRRAISANDKECMDLFRPKLEDGPGAYFENAWAFTQLFYGAELTRIGNTKFECVTPDFFFREYIWVVHATGFNARVVAKMMPKLLAAYGTYEQVAREDFDELYALHVKPICAHRGKSHAIWKTATLLKSEIGRVGWKEFRNYGLKTPALLRHLEFIGPITCFHLARNIGLLEFVKPDLHLVRLSEYWSLRDPTEMCKIMRGVQQIPLGLVDLAVWYLASTFGTLDAKKTGER